MALQLFKIASTTVESPQATVEFTSIPSGYTDLKIVYSGRNNRVDTTDHILIGFNGGTTSITNRQLYGFATSVGSITSVPRSVGFINSTNATANTFSNAEVYIPNYTSSNYKSYSADNVDEMNNSGDNGLWLTAGLWSSTSAITSISLTSNIGTAFVANSTFTLYGVL